MSRKHFLTTVLFLLTTCLLQAQETERQYLSGTGLGNTTTWQFRVSEGRNSGHWSKIEVPSNGNCKASANIPMVAGTRSRV
ncbi:hypothetical protein [Bacteroides stercorirosoris]|uniref:hypothetical protein n=1 Tax=Bacteroides stercorirosoris TaxID=871324 RepID=UPI0026AB12C2